MEALRGEPGVAGPPYLIRHERNQGAHYDRKALEHERGDLIADALPSTGGEDSYRIPPLQRGGDELPLSRPESRVTEVAPKHGFRMFEFAPSSGHARSWPNTEGDPMRSEARYSSEMAFSGEEWGAA